MMVRPIRNAGGAAARRPLTRDDSVQHASPSFGDGNGPMAGVPDVERTSLNPRSGFAMPVGRHQSIEHSRQTGNVSIAPGKRPDGPRANCCRVTPQKWSDEWKRIGRGCVNTVADRNARKGGEPSNALNDSGCSSITEACASAVRFQSGGGSSWRFITAAAMARNIADKSGGRVNWSPISSAKDSRLATRSFVQIAISHAIAMATVRMNEISSTLRAP